MTQIIPVERIENRILVLRRQRVMLSTDLADLYDVSPKVLMQAVRRNLERFPADFMFRLRRTENRLLRSQIVTLDRGRGRYSKYPPYAFTEQGVAMLSSVLRSRRAVQANIGIMRAFVRLRQILATHADLARKLAEMERKYDARFRVVFEAIRGLMGETQAPRRRIGFHAGATP